jgi:hypothetical protein
MTKLYSEGPVSDEELEIEPIVSVSMGIIKRDTDTSDEQFRVVVFFNGGEDFQKPVNLEQHMIVKHYNIMFGQMMKTFFEAYSAAQDAARGTTNSPPHSGH